MTAPPCGERRARGVIGVRSGVVRFDGQDASGMRSDRLVARGLAHVPEGRPHNPFPSQPVASHLEQNTR